MGSCQSLAQPRTRCVLLRAVAGEGKLKYNQGHAKNLSENQPCTNHLVECKDCEAEQGRQRPAIWSYNLVDHYRQEHSSHEVPAIARVSELEKELW